MGYALPLAVVAHWHALWGGVPVILIWALLVYVVAFGRSPRPDPHHQSTDRILAGYEQEYVDGKLDLDQLEETVGRYLGLTRYQPKIAPQSRSQQGVELDRRGYQIPLAMISLDSGGAGGVSPVAWSSSSYATHVMPARPMRTVELRDGADRVIKHVAVPD